MMVLRFDSDNSVRAAAIVALGQLKAEQAIPILKAVARDDNDPGIKLLTEDAINQILSSESN